MRSLLSILGQEARHAQSAGALNAGYEEAIHVFLVGTCEVRYIGIQHYLLPGERGGELAPDGGSAHPHEFDAGHVQPAQHGKDVLYAVGIVAPVEGEEHPGIAVAWGYGSAGLEGVDRVDRSAGAHEGGEFRTVARGLGAIGMDEEQLASFPGGPESPR